MSGSWKIHPWIICFYRQRRLLTELHIDRDDRVIDVIGLPKHFPYEGLVHHITLDLCAAKFNLFPGKNRSIQWLQDVGLRDSRRTDFDPWALKKHLDGIGEEFR